MDFQFTDEQLLLADSLKEILQRLMPEERIQECYDKEELPWAEWKEFCDAGFGGIGFPEEMGGTPCDMVTQTLANYTIAKYGGPLSTFVMLGQTCMHDLRDFGSEEQKKAILEPLMQGGSGFSLCITEPGAGSDEANIQSTYVHDGDNLIINAHKHYNSSANDFDWLMLVLRDPTVENPYQAMSMVVIPKNTPGVRINPLPKMGGKHPSAICEVFVDGAVVPKSCILGQEHAGFLQLMKNFESERLGTCACSLALAESAYEDACTYANQRVQFGKAIGKYQLIQEHIMQMKVEVENMRNMVFKNAWMLDHGMNVRIDSGLMKYYCSRAAYRVLDHAVQVLGGVGLVGEHRVIRNFAEARVQRIGAGSDEIMIKNTVPQILKQFV